MTIRSFGKVGIVLAGLFCGVVLPGVAIAALTDTVTLGGEVASTLSVVATDTAGASTLNLTGGAGQQIVKVADVNIITNNSTGFSLTSTSGNITKTGGQPIAFQVVSVADTVVPVQATFTVATGSPFVDSSTSSAGSADKDLYIMYTPGAVQDPGIYAGTIGLTVADL